MPGEERKFRRRRIVALLPACRRERAEADSQAVVGIRVSPLAVGEGSITVVPVGEAGGAATFVAVGDGSEAVDPGSIVPVGDGIGVDVDSITRVAVGEGRGVGEGISTMVAVGEGSEVVAANSIVPVGDENELEVDSIAGFAVVVREEGGVAVAADSRVAADSSVGLTVGVSVGDIDVPAILVESAADVAEEPVEINLVGESAVDPGARA